MLKVSAPAKVNLTLEVLGKRSDSYHDILSVIQTIDLCDTLTIAPAADIEFTCNVAGLVSADNLVVRAARSFRAATGYPGGAAIHLEKRIPLAAGLGGGSSDAAATLKGLARLWGADDFPYDRAIDICAQLGMDVPFFLAGGTAVLRGRGDVVDVLPALPPTHLVLLHPAMLVADKTRRMYGALTPENYSDGRATSRLAGVIRESGRLDDSLLLNAFESMVGSVFPDLASVWRRFTREAGRPVHLAGAGPTLYCLADDRAKAERLQGSLVSMGFEAYSCQTLDGGERWT